MKIFKLSSDRKQVARSIRQAADSCFKISVRILFVMILSPVVFLLTESCTSKNSKDNTGGTQDSVIVENATDPADYNPEPVLLVTPRNPAPGEAFRIFAAGGKSILKAEIFVMGPNGKIQPIANKKGTEIPYWRMDDFAAAEAGKYNVILNIEGKETALGFEIAPNKTVPQKGVWTTTRSWDNGTELLYSAWINALFGNSNEQTSWAALHEVTRDKERNLLYNHLSLGEDDANSKIKVAMEPDCADNPFFLRAYFAWKLGLPFGYHLCDRGYIGKNPQAGEWITNETSPSKSNPVQSFNIFLRILMNGVHSGTGRTALDNEKSDYYPVALERTSLLPGTVFADPYGHTFTLVSWLQQTKKEPGVLLAVDAQPDGTVAIKRFWKGNFLFTTAEVVGEPGFKMFRPIVWENGKTKLLSNQELTKSSGFVPFSMQQKNMDSETFYRAMERLINPKPLDPEDALLDLISALHEQLQMRVKSVDNGEAYMKAHPGAVIPMPSNAKGVFLTGGQWEDFSTPNRDLRLLIAMDAVTGFTERVVKYPGDFDIPALSSPEKMKEKLQTLLEEKTNALTISYTRTDGSKQELTLAEILKRKDAFEMAYNPNDCVEVRWGAPENSAERSTGKRRAPASQQKTMEKVRDWFGKRLHPPT